MHILPGSDSTHGVHWYSSALRSLHALVGDFCGDDAITTK
jgi:hypothetical protein